MNEEQILFKITREEDGVAINVHCNNIDDIINTTRSIASVAKSDDVFGVFLLTALKYYFTEEGEKDLEQNSVEIPDFNKILKNKN